MASTELRRLAKDFVSIRDLAPADLAALLDLAGRFIPPPQALALFGFGWILQGIGHWVYEENSPAFFRNFVHLAVGQLWILARALGRA